VVDAEAAGAVCSKDEEAARDRDVLHQVDRLVLVAGCAMEEEAGKQREYRQPKRRPTGGEAEQDGETTKEFDCDDDRQQARWNAHRIHVSLGSGVAADLAPAGNDEDEGQADAAEQGGEVVHG
jgi:hypothetical protein